MPIFGKKTVASRSHSYLSTSPTRAYVAVSMVLVQVYAQAESIIKLIQQLYGLQSMPILSVFILGLVFKNVHAHAGIFSVVFGVALNALLSFEGSPMHAPFGLHFIHLMFITLISCVGLSLLLNWLVYKQKPVFTLAALKGPVAEAK